MSNANNIREQVWESDIAEQELLIRDNINGLTNIYERLRFQQAPPALIERIFEVRADLSKSLDNLAELRRCFPPRPIGG